MVAVGSLMPAHVHLQPGRAAESSPVFQATLVVCEPTRDLCACSDVSTSTASHWAGQQPETLQGTAQAACQACGRLNPPGTFMMHPCILLPEGMSCPDLCSTP